MNRTLKRCCFLLVTLLLVVPWKVGASPGIVPNPTCVTLESGVTPLSAASTIYYADAALSRVAALLQRDLLLVHALDLDVRAGSTAGAADILLRLNRHFPKTEKYRLTVNDSVTLESGSVAGIYEGTVSFLQAVRSSGPAWQISKMTLVAGAIQLRETASPSTVVFSPLGVNSSTTYIR